MNNSIFQVIHGQFVHALADSGQLMLSAKNGWSITIYNKFSVFSDNGREVNPLEIDGMTLDSSSMDSKKITLFFNLGYTIEIYLSDDAFNGPEAFQLAGPNSEIIVW
jgi:hypothetical protein